jgi:hypothetical protein
MERVSSVDEGNVYPNEWTRQPRVRQRGDAVRYALLPPASETQYAEEICSKNPVLIAQSETVSLVVDEAMFNRLRDEWRRSTSALSLLDKKVMHPSYQRIIGMGPTVIPLILKEMRARPGHWFWALDALTQGASPAKDSANLIEATAAWLRWGEAEGYL